MLQCIAVIRLIHTCECFAAPRLHVCDNSQTQVVHNDADLRVALLDTNMAPFGVLQLTSANISPTLDSLVYIRISLCDMTHSYVTRLMNL